MGLRLPMALLGLDWLLGAQPVSSFDRQQVLEQMRQSRPADLKVLIERPAPVGTLSIGIYGVKPTPSDPNTRSYSLWKKSASDLNVCVESVNCSTTKPLRVKLTPYVIYVRSLNPGARSPNSTRRITWCGGRPACPRWREPTLPLCGKKPWIWAFPP